MLLLSNIKAGPLCTTSTGLRFGSMHSVNRQFWFDAIYALLYQLFHLTQEPQWCPAGGSPWPYHISGTCRCCPPHWSKPCSTSATSLEQSI